MSLDIVTLVRETLRNRLLTVPGLPAAPNQQWEGTTFAPTMGEPWFRETMLRPPAGPRAIGGGTGALIRHTGGWQISLFYPVDDPDDVGPIEAMGGAIRDAFPNAIDLVFDPASAQFAGQLVRVESCGLGTIVTNALQGAPWLHLPVRIAWYADTLNPI